MIFIFSSLQMHAANGIILSVSGANKLSVIENSTSRLQVYNTIGSFNTLLVNTDKGEFVELVVNSYSKTNLVGAPQLPVLSRLIEVPEGSIPQVKVISYDVSEYKLSDFGITQKLFPVQPPQSKNTNLNEPIVFNKQLYETNSFYGESLARVEVAGYMRNIQLANLILSPVEYNPVTNSIKVYDNLVVEIRFAGAPKTKSAEYKSNMRSPYFNSVFNTILNIKPDEALPGTTTSSIPVKYVIVSDPMFRDALQSFVKWKIKRGFNVIEAYTSDPAVGNTSKSIKSYLQNLYTSATSSDPAPTFVLFVGDVAQVPAYNCGSHVSDLYYCDYTGDYLPEVYYGRFSANTVAELLPQINKTLQYEQYLMPDPSFLNEVVLSAGADASHQERWGNGQVNYGTSNYFNAAHHLVAHTYLQPEPAGNNYSKSIQVDISDGAGFVNNTAHGSPDGWADPTFTIQDVAKLQNAGKYGLIVGNSCQTNSYNLNSFGEALVRAENKGALGYIGASDLTYWDEDYWWSVGNGSVTAHPTYETTGSGAYDRIFHDHGEPRSEWYSTMGQMVFAGNLAVQESNSGLKKYYWEIYCLMGDPSTMIYFSMPPAMKVDYQPFLPLGTSSFEVRTEPYAYVAISKNNKLHGVAEADENGLAVVSLQAFSEPGYANLVITKQNLQPYIDSIMVASPEGPYLVLDNFKINDTKGNNNQSPEPGEAITMDLSMNNVGLSVAEKAKSTLMTNDSYVTILSNTYTWPFISGNGSASALNVFALQVKDNVPDLHKSSLTITTQSDTSTFTSEFNFVVYAPELFNGNITFDDAKAGNGNGQIDPGESIYITVPVTNTGHCTSAEVTTQLFVFGDNVTANSRVLNLGPLVSGETDTSVFSFTVSPDAAPGSVFSLYVSATAGPYNSVSSLLPVIGSQVEDFETADFTKYSWQMKGDRPWEISSDVKSGGLFGAESGTINNSERSELVLEGQVLIADTISFYRKVSSETGYDFLKFYLDGNELGSWSGNLDWEKVSYPIPAGNHRLSWSYIKDEATSAGQDAAWIDNIRLPAFTEALTGPLEVKALAEPATICAGDQSQLFVFTTGGTATYSYLWNPSLTINDAGIFNPRANPPETTTYDVQVTSKSESVNSKITLNVIPVPEAPVVKVSGDHLVSSATTGNQWYNSHGPIAGALAQTYYPDSAETYYVRINIAKGCPSNASNAVVLGLTGNKTSSENGFSVYPNPFNGRLNIDYTINSACQVKILVYNSIGREIAKIEAGMQSAGDHKAVFNGSGMPAGIYTCMIFNGDKVKFARVVKLR